jgi:hypothetical protein
LLLSSGPVDVFETYSIIPKLANMFKNAP